MTQAPALIRHSGPITRRLLRRGFPLGPNLLLTVPGRTSGLPRTAPLAVVRLGDRRWVVGTFGDVHWVRNLRAAGLASLRLDGRDLAVDARELSHAEATTFFAETLPAYLRTLPRVWRLFLRAFLRIVAPDIRTDPSAAARHRPVFELTPDRQSAVEA